MSNTIDNRSAFFPRGRNIDTGSAKGTGQVESLQKNSMERATEIQDRTGADAKVSIPDGVKDFSRIKKAAMTAPEQDNSEKIARLKAQIQAGTYEVDYDGLADKILTTEF